MRPMSLEDKGYEAARLSSSDPSSGPREHVGGVSALSAGIAARTGYGLPSAERAGEGGRGGAGAGRQNQTCMRCEKAGAHAQTLKIVSI